MNASTTPTTSCCTAEAASGSNEGPSASSDFRPSATSNSSGSDADVPPEPDGDCAGEIDFVIDREVRHPIDAPWLLRSIRQSVQQLPEHAREPAPERINVLVVDDERMRALHREHCQANTTTDVLTFPYSEPGEPIEVEIAVCADEAARRADEFGHAIEHELLLYVLHGLLHCCGYDDHDEASFTRMHELEDTILQAIGVGRTFAKRPKAGAPKPRNGGGA